MSIKDCTPQELDRKQITEVINKAMHKTYNEVEKLADMEMEEVKEQASYELAYKTTLYHMMLQLSEVVQEFKQMGLLNQLESIKRMSDMDIDIENTEELQPEEVETITNSMEDILNTDHKYTTLNNEILMVLLFEVAKDILTEEEFLTALLV